MSRLITTIGLLGLAVDPFLVDLIFQARRTATPRALRTVPVAGSPKFALFLGAPLADTYVRPALRAAKELESS